MTNRKSILTMEARKAYDQISFLMGKGGRELLRVLALRDDTTISEVLRDAVIARAGLSTLPPSEDLAALAAVQSSDDANAAIIQLREKEKSAPVRGDSGEMREIMLTPDEWETILTLADLVEVGLQKMNTIIAAQGVGAPGTSKLAIAVSLDDLAHLRRMLATSVRVRREIVIPEDGVTVCAPDTDSIQKYIQK